MASERFSASISMPSAHSFCTVMRFCVSVPVLSEQITDTAPRLSTAFRSFKMAFCRAIFCVLMASTMVTIEESASGMAATASATANISESKRGIWLRNTDKRNTPTHTTRMTAASFLEKSSRLFCSGVRRCCVWFISAAILPSSVCMPVAVISTEARP